MRYGLMSTIGANTSTLLLTGTMPGENGVGDIYLKSLLEHLQNPNICIAHISESNRGNQTSHIDGVEYRGYRSLYRRFVRVPRWCGVLLEAAKECFIQWTDEKRIADEIVDFARARNVEVLWAVLDAPPMYRLALQVSKCLRVPLITTVWDPPDGVSRLHLRNTIIRSLDRTSFERTMASAVCAAVISERMAAEYSAQFGIPVSVVRYGLSNDVIRSVEPCQPVKDEFRIAFCGSVYAIEEWEALLAALNSIRWTCDGKPVRLIVAARELPRLKLNGPANITLLGWRSTYEVEAMLKTCHAGYLPYWFSADYSESVRLCFATKLSNYLAAGLPVLYHGPRDSAVGDFIDRYQIGVCCGSLESLPIIEAISELANGEKRSCFTVGIRSALQEELNSDVFLARFRQLLLELPIVPAPLHV